MHVSPTLQLFHRELDEFGFSGVEVRRGQTKTEIIIRAAKAQDVLGEWVPRAAWSEALPALAEPPQLCLWWQPLPLLLQTLVPPGTTAVGTLQGSSSRAVWGVGRGACAWRASRTSVRPPVAVV